MSDVRRPRSRAVSIFVAVVTCIGAAFCACTVYHANGEQCLKDEDCISGLCISQVCGSPNPTLSGNYPDDASSTSSEDSGGGGADSGVATADSGKSSDGAADAPSDGPAVIKDSGHDTGTPDMDANDGAGDIDSATDSATDDAASDDGSTQDAFLVVNRASQLA